VPSVRDDIVNELITRLNTLNPPIRLFEGSGAIDQIQNFPSVFLFEDSEEVSYNKPGKYEKVLPLQIEYFHKLNDPSAVYSEGRRILQAINTAVEIDDRFSELCVKYFMAANQVYEMRTGVVDVVVVYRFHYVDSFLGHDSRRPFGLTK
jgi:hypothetical protein